MVTRFLFYEVIFKLNSSENTYCVYKHVSKINGETYIGITKYGNDPNRRWKNGRGYKHTKYSHFYRSILKHGWDSYDHIVIKNGLSKEEAAAEEIALIAKFKASSPDLLLNISPGGSLGCGLSGENSPSYGKSPSIESRRKMSIAKNGEFTGKPKYPPSKIIDLDTKQIFNTIKDCAEYYGISANCITQVVRHKNYSTHGYHFAKLDEYEKYGIVDQRVLNQRTQIYGRPVLCIETNITYKTVKEASEKTGIPEDSIYYAVVHKNHLTYGYHFVYPDAF